MDEFCSEIDSFWATYVHKNAVNKDNKIQNHKSPFILTIEMLWIDPLCNRYQWWKNIEHGTLFLHEFGR